MGINIKLYAHGNPNGQNLWNVDKFAESYIPIFYGKKSQVKKQMFVEVRNFENQKNAFYTFFISNTLEADGRSGGYFALTLCINRYYADVQNIYNLLEAAFNKFIVGEIVEPQGESFRFKISKFSEKESWLKRIENQINNYLNEFSKNEDFISLENFATQGEEKKVNLQDYNSSEILNFVKNDGGIVVSPLFQSKEKEEIRKETEQKISAMKIVCQKQIQEIEAKYKDADKKLVQLVQNLAKADKIVLEQNSSSPKPQTPEKLAEQKTILAQLNDYFPAVAVLLLLLLVLIFISSAEISTSSSLENKKLEQKIEKLSNENEKLKDEISKLKSSGNSEFIDIKSKYKNAKINIVGASEPLIVNKTYKVEIVGISDDLKIGKWEGKFYKVNGNQVAPTTDVGCDLKYVVNGEEVCVRKIKVIKPSETPIKSTETKTEEKLPEQPKPVENPDTTKK